MIDGLKPYPAYKESSISWLGKVPVHWTVCPIKTVLRELHGRATDGRGTLLSLTRLRGLIPHGEMTSKIHSAKTLAGYKQYSPGNIVMNRMQAWSGMFGIGSIDGLVSPDYAVFEILGGHAVKLILERLKSPDLVGQFALESKGIGSGFNRLYTDRFGALPISLPPLDEQSTIVRFLDHANGRLERAIRAKKKLIALLNEQKQVIIHRAVTRGINPTAPLKPSDIPWVGEIPKHWEVLRAKYLFQEVDERSRSGNEELLSVSHLTGVTPRSEKNITMFKASSYIGHKLCRPGDLVVNTMWAWMAALGVSAYTGIVSPAYAVYRPRFAERVVGNYVDGLLRTRSYVSNIICHSTGIRASRLRLYPEEFFRLSIILPPTTEQMLIVERISIETARLNDAIVRTEREISLLREYRTRLVADVVTGKLDVREAAANLPEQATEPESLSPEDDPNDDVMELAEMEEVNE